MNERQARQLLKLAQIVAVDYSWFGGQASTSALIAHWLERNQLALTGEDEERVWRAVRNRRYR